MSTVVPAGSAVRAVRSVYTVVLKSLQPSAKGGRAKSTIQPHQGGSVAVTGSSQESFFPVSSQARLPRKTL